MAQASTIIYTHPDCAFSSAVKMDYRKRKGEDTEMDLAKQADQIPSLVELTWGGGEKAGSGGKGDGPSGGKAGQ